MIENKKSNGRTAYFESLSAEGRSITMLKTLHITITHTLSLLTLGFLLARVARTRLELYLKRTRLECLDDFLLKRPI